MHMVWLRHASDSVCACWSHAVCRWATPSSCGLTGWACTRAWRQASTCQAPWSCACPSTGPCSTSVTHAACSPWRRRWHGRQTGRTHHPCHPSLQMQRQQRTTRHHYSPCTCSRGCRCAALVEQLRHSKKSYGTVAGSRSMEAGWLSRHARLRALNCHCSVAFRLVVCIDLAGICQMGSLT